MRPLAPVTSGDVSKAHYHTVHPALKHRHVKALVRLSGATRLYLERLVLDGIEIIGDAVGGGSFADIFKGRLVDQDITIKVLKVYQKLDIEKLLKVTSKYVIFMMSTKGHFQEFSSTVTWRQLLHPNVLPFYGVYQLARNPPRVCLACPWMENGNLAQFLADHAPNTDCILLVHDKLETKHNIHYEHSPSHLTSYWVWSIYMARVLSTEILKQCIFGRH